MELIALLLVAAIGCLLWNRLRVAGIVPPAHLLLGRFADRRDVGSRGELGPLIAALYDSLINRSRRTWWTRRYHVDGEAWTIVAASVDAPLLAQEAKAVESDLNTAVADNSGRHRITVSAPLTISKVVTDDSVQPGRPCLIPSHAASSYAGAGAELPETKPWGRTNLDRRWEPPIPDATRAPTELFKTELDEPAEDEVVRLWPVGAQDADGPITVPQGGLVLGRDPKLGEGRLIGGTISARHAKLELDGATWTIDDLTSRNGTFVNGLRVEQSPVRHGDIVGLGKHIRMRFIVGDIVMAPTAPLDG